MQRSGFARSDGYSFIEILLALGLVTTLAGIAVPVASGTIDDIRAAGAARHVAARIAMTRLEAVRRSSSVALRFQQQGRDYAFTPFLDGNGNGLRAADINNGVDHPLGPTERLGDQFGDAGFGLLPGIPDLDGVVGNEDGVRIGPSAFLSVSSNGSCTGGTIYVHGRRTQYAVRVLGATGRVRFFRYDTGTGRWITR